MKTIVFDIGGTLLPTPAKRVVTKVAQEFEIPLKLNKIRTMTINAIAEEVQSYGIDREIFFDRYWEIYSTEVKKESLFPETRVVLQKLKEMGMQLAIFSDIRKNVIHEILRNNDIEHFFETYVCLDNVNPKPDPEGLYHIFDCLSVSKEDVLFVGDRIVDRTAGEKAGVEVLLINHSKDLLKILDHKILTTNQESFTILH